MFRQPPQTSDSGHGRRSREERPISINYAVGTSVEQRPRKSTEETEATDSGPLRPVWYRSLQAGRTNTTNRADDAPKNKVRTMKK